MTAGRPKAPCGTASAYRRHKNNGEPIDELCAEAHLADLEDRAIAAKAGGKPATRPTYRKVNFIKETLSNLTLIDNALKIAPVDRIGPLSKRKSELLKELKEYQNADPSATSAPKPEVDPLDAALDGGAGMTNVTRLTA